VRFPAPACRDADFDGVTGCAGDCDDANPKSFRGTARCATVSTTTATDRSTRRRLLPDLSEPRKDRADVRVTFNGPRLVYPALVWAGWIWSGLDG